MREVMRKSVMIDAPQQVVWELMTDIKGAEERIRGVQKVEILTDGPVGKGTRWRETRVLMGKEATEEMEISEWEPPRRYVALAESHGTRYRTTLTCESKGEGRTEATFVMEAQPLNLKAKVTGAIFSGMMKKMMDKCVTEDLEDLKQAAEARAGGGAPGEESAATV